MKKRITKAMREREAVDFLEIGSRKPNVIRVNLHNSFEHEVSKFIVAWNLMKAGNSIVTEGKFKTGGIADVICLSSGDIYEILSSEKVEDCKEKVKKYPEYFNVNISKVNDLIGNFKRRDL